LKGVLDARGWISHCGHPVIFKTHHQVGVLPQGIQSFEGLFPTAAAFKREGQSRKHRNVGTLCPRGLRDARRCAGTGTATKPGKKNHQRRTGKTRANLGNTLQRRSAPQLRITPCSQPSGERVSENNTSGSRSGGQGTGVSIGRQNLHTGQAISREAIHRMCPCTTDAEDFHIPLRVGLEGSGKFNHV
jgi:hypothetical protein